MMPLAFVPRQKMASLALFFGLAIVSAQAFCTPSAQTPASVPPAEAAAAEPTPEAESGDELGDPVGTSDSGDFAEEGQELGGTGGTEEEAEEDGTVVGEYGAPPTYADGTPAQPADVGELGLPGPAPFDFKYRRRPAPEPREISYIVGPGDTIDGLAERYGVERDDIIAKNKLSRKKPRIRRGQKLRIDAQRFPVPRLRVKYKVAEDDTWESVAESYGITVEELRDHNRRVKARKLRKGMKLFTWVESNLPRLADASAEREPWDFATTIPDGAISRGHPNWGRLQGGIQVPESSLYTLRTPKHAYGSSHTLRVLQHSIAAFRHETGYPGEVLVCSLSKRRGGKFRPHKSHQSGRDIDISLVPYPNFPQGEKASGGRVDWAATWALMRQFIETGQITYIFLSYHLQPRLYEAAKAMGATDEELEAYIQWPHGRGRTNALIRHSKGHDAHFHVRIKCSPDELRCAGY